jgi:5-methyltetrahydropteroyltriglutamate--homocysteine methyltransferase
MGEMVEKMSRRAERILTTHAGSLPRPDTLVRMMWDWLDKKPVDMAMLDKQVESAVFDNVKKQLDAGVDIVGDGEMSKVGFSNYVIQRYEGFGELAPDLIADDLAEVPSVGDPIFVTSEYGKHIVRPVVDGPIKLRNPDAIKSDIATLKAALNGRSPDLAFLTAVTPGQMLFNFPNRYYPSDEAYLEAVGEALRFEYQAIVDAGLNLQLDSPDLAMRGHFYYPGAGPEKMNKYIPMVIEALNHATRGIPAEKMRLHLCWGNYPGPHHHDIELREIINPVLKVSAALISFEAANPRHAHEWEVWAEAKIPDGKTLVPGVIDTLTNHVEHPRLVAQRLERFANIVGKENVIASTDCGFGTFVGWAGCDPKVVWLKLHSMAEGARIASERLW